MRPVLTPEQARAFDRTCIEKAQVGGLVLMENAGLGATLALLPESSPRRPTCIVCGPGNNGGDGLVVARQLISRGHAVRVLLYAPARRLSADAAAQRAAFRGVGGRLAWMDDESIARGALAGFFDSAGLVVDALFGTGLSRPLREGARALVEAMNDSGLPIVALDLPSGLCSRTGRVLGAAVVATRTLSFGHLKLGQLTGGGAEHCGALRVVPLGVPASLGPGAQPEAFQVEPQDVAGWLPPRSVAGHKGRSGRVRLFAGGAGKLGAAQLAARGALRGGGGLVSVCTWPELADGLQHATLEAMVERLDPDQPEQSALSRCEGADSVVIGPGFGLGQAARRAARHVVLHWAGPKVVDADALSAFAGEAEALRGAAGHCVLTPHPGELGRLLGESAATVEADRFGAVRQASDRTQQVVLLKGPHTLVADPGGSVWVCSSGSPALATGGTGDVLSGLCGALLVQLSPKRGAAAAAVLHGLAARCWSKRRAGAIRGLLAHELADALPEVFASLAAPVGPLSE